MFFKSFPPKFFSTFDTSYLLFRNPIFFLSFFFWPLFPSVGLIPLFLEESELPPIFLCAGLFIFFGSGGPSHPGLFFFDDFGLPPVFFRPFCLFRLTFCHDVRGGCPCAWSPPSNNPFFTPFLSRFSFIPWIPPLPPPATLTLLGLAASLFLVFPDLASLFHCFSGKRLDFCRTYGCSSSGTLSKFFHPFSRRSPCPFSILVSFSVSSFFCDFSFFHQRPLRHSFQTPFFNVFLAPFGFLLVWFLILDQNIFPRPDPFSQFFFSSCRLFHFFFFSSGIFPCFNSRRPDRILRSWRGAK